MKPHLLKIELQPEHSFNVRHDIVPHFYNKWHYHDEIEIVHVIKGSGQQFVGDSIRNFNPDDLLLLGANLPHLWKSDQPGNDSVKNVEAVVIHFKPDCFGEGFFTLPENKKIFKLLQRARQGISIDKGTKRKATWLIQQLLQAKNSSRIITLLQLLETISGSADIKMVSSPGLEFNIHPAEAERLNTIYQYILNNFNREIPLAQIAEVASIGPQSFCRYFKSRTKKTFSTFLMEVRIGHACKLLTETDKSISEICYESGFNNISNFNRYFKLITGKTPSTYRGQLWDEK